MKVIVVLLSFLIVSCYNQRKAQTQFGKAAVTYPNIPAQFCAITYPPKITVLKGDTITKTDTIQKEGTIIEDTLITFDTVRITITKTLPGQVITKTIHVTDTFQVENTAKVKECELERSKTLDLLGAANTKADKFERQAKMRLWIMISFLLALLISLYFNLRKLFK